MLSLSILRANRRGSFQVRAGIALVAVGEGFIAFHLRPITDFYFPVVWLGYILIMDGALYAATGRSLSRDKRNIFLAMFPLSACCWWIFEAFNMATKNWQYMGAQNYKGLAYVCIASLDFSTVLPAVWLSALVLRHLLPPLQRATSRPNPPPHWLLCAEFLAGVICLLLPLFFPSYFFGLIWGSAFFLLDPINAGLGRPSIVAAVWSGNWLQPAAFALGALMCGFFWESWNYWAIPKWVYHIPYVGYFRIYEMPVLGWIGYLPFGLELFAMANFVFPLLRLGAIDLELSDHNRRPRPVQTAAS